MIGLCPAFILQIGDDVLAAHWSGRFAKKYDRLANTGFMMALFPMPITILPAASKRIEPAADFGIGLIK